MYEGYDPSQWDFKPDLVVIGNVLSRGNSAVEFVLNQNWPYVSGPEWLAQAVLKNRHVLAVAGTHGKTTTTSILTWILEKAGKKPGFLIGGVPENFGISARLGDDPYFVIEADEYDSAFFDKRSKCLHYKPKTAILNNLEFDHADIFRDLADIEQQFHYFVRTIPSDGLIITLDNDAALGRVLEKGCWTSTERFGMEQGAHWQVHLLERDASEFEIGHQGTTCAKVKWSLLGNHNACNALAAIVAANNIGITPETSAAALTDFKSIKRRLQLRGEAKGIKVYDDFAHHPTAINTTLAGLRAHVGNNRIFAVLEMGSYTMKTGYHGKSITKALQLADQSLLLRPTETTWDLNEICQQDTKLYETTEAIIKDLITQCQQDDHILIMSNKSFDNIHQKLLTALGA